MSDLENLLEELAACDAKGDTSGLRRIREQIIVHYFDSEAATEAFYKLGLDSLFIQRDLDAAVEKFNRAAKRKDSYWSLAARTSLGLCYYHQRRTQKALLELRKVAHTDNPNDHSVTALAFLETIFANEGAKEELLRIRKERIAQLEKLVKRAAENGTRQTHGHYLYCLALAVKDSGEHDRAKQLLQEAQAFGKAALGADLHRSIAEALTWR